MTPLTPVYAIVIGGLLMVFAIRPARAWLWQTGRDAIKRAGDDVRGEVVKWAGITAVGVVGTLTAGEVALNFSEQYIALRAAGGGPPHTTEHNVCNGPGDPCPKSIVGRFFDSTESPRVPRLVPPDSLGLDLVPSRPGGLGPALAGAAGTGALLDSVMYPNIPASARDTVFHYDGTTGNLGALWSRVNGWDTLVTSVDDADNPNGTGKMLQMIRYPGQFTPGIAEADTLCCGNKDTIYIALRIRYSANSAWDSTGHKIHYWGSARDARTQGLTNPSQFYVTRESNGASNVAQQNSPPTDNLIVAGAGSIPIGSWTLLEQVHIYESAAGGAANDGKSYYYINGSLIDSAVNVSWADSGSVGFNGFTMWQSDAAAVGTADTVFVRDLIYVGNN